MRLKGLLKYIVILSNIVFWGMTSSLSRQNILVHFFIAIVCTLGLWKCDIWKCYKKANIVSKLLGCIVASVVVYSAAKHFISIEQMIFGRELAIQWIVLAGLGACITIFFIVFIFTCAFDCVMSLIKMVCQSEFWSILRDKIKLKGMIFGGINIIIAACGAVILMTLVYMIPVDSIEKNLYSSAEAIKNETTYPQLTGLCTSQLDNWTDSIMLAEAGERSEGSALHRALLVNRGTMEGYNPFESLIAHYVESKDYDAYTQYPRYWHGYLIFLKPLLTFMTYPQIRVLNGVIEVILFIVVCILFYRKRRTEYIVPWLLGYLMLMPIALAKSLQFSPCYYAYTIGSIILLILTKQKRSQYIGMIFLNIGIFTAFFDFLTFPVISFCIPAAVYFALDSERNVKTTVVDLLKSGFCWCSGYIGMWASKWVLGTVITGTNILDNAREAIELRSSHVSQNGEEVFSVFECLLKNMDSFLYTPVVIIVAVWIIFSIKKYRSKTELEYNKKMKLILPYIVLGVIPIAWYSVTVNHSSIHYWFTNKTLVALLMPAILGFAQLQTAKIKKEKNK